MNDNMRDLIKGYNEFKDFYFKENEDRLDNLIKEGQKPKALFIGCSDSRVIPEMITNSDPGELFIVRNVGNFVAPFRPDEDFHATASAIEYAVGVLDVTDIIICGHSHCGAIEALYKDIKPNTDNIHTMKWLELGMEAKNLVTTSMPNASKYELLKQTEKASVIFQLKNLLTYPLVKKKVLSKELFIHGWYYDMDDGIISYYDNEENIFKPLVS